MALAPDLQLAELALNELEALEARCLVWGLIDSALSREEVMEALQRVLDNRENESIKNDPNCSILTARDLRDLLVKCNMLFQVPFVSDQELRWRTRMAEGVRLIAQLRQLFPKHGSDHWAEAATLVADYRFLRRSRRYPERNLTAPAVHAKLSESVQSPLLLEALKTWLDRMDKGGGLAKFQVRSAERILAGLEARSCAGTLVSAGTGSGKTLAFYLPALSWLASQRVQSHDARGVRVLALYPRNELLKDQLAEVYDQCRKFDSWIARQGGRPLRVGVLYGDTPTKVSKTNWPRHAQGGKRVPFFNCPKDSQHGEMVLRPDDASRGVERLVCTHPQCNAVVDGHTLAFTRDAIKSDPPDILFTSVEMLNRHLSNSDLRHVFGVGPNAARAPDLILLDEVHLYAGSYGAQVAYLLRRWWASTGRRSSFVGLSATIADGQTFFSHLTGLSKSVVEEIKPLEDEIVEEGAEYMLALRGDPVSQTALLSTTIQTLMLSARLLDPPVTFDKKSMPFYGWRAFAFTDQLDAANRLFMDLRDAEGRYPSGVGGVNLTRHPDGGLARLRRGTTPIIGSSRYYAGQDWSIPEAIGHDLSYQLGVGRTTALDSGVSLHTEVVVATSALEVGFDDPAVGVVVQHKAPRDIASFLQRKGRAGRTRHMRPWTIVVLTDYGRDRLAYQAYDQLFDPDLPARQLPLANRYVQRMQVVYALLDELGEWTCRDQPGFSVWRDLAHPNNDAIPDAWIPSAFDSVKRLAERVQLPLSVQAWQALKAQALSLAPNGVAQDIKYAGANWLAKRLKHQRVVKLLGDVLEIPTKAERLTRNLADRLALTTDDMNVLMWSQPRSLMLGAIPTAIRRLASGWRAHGQPGKDYQAGHPLPDFIPANLFSDLSLPEMLIVFPANQRDLGDQYLPVQQGLGEFAPGKVSRRYDDALWLGVDGQALARFFNCDAAELSEAADLSAWYDLEPQSDFIVHRGSDPVVFKAFRPVVARLGSVPRWGNGIPELSDTSNAQLKWQSFLQAPSQGLKLDSPPHIGISQLIKRVALYTHAEQSNALVRRYAIGSRADLRLRSGGRSKQLSIDWQFMEVGRPCGVGFDIDVDALVLELDLPPDLWRAIDWSDPRRGRAARAARYNWEARQNSAFSTVVPNPFLRGWIAQIFQIAALQVAVAEQCTLRDSLDLVAGGARMETLLNVLQTVFQVSDQDGSEDGADKLRQKLNEALQSESVLQAVRSASGVLVDPIDEKWNDWLALSIRATLGSACLEAIQQACPQVDPDGLVVDIEVVRDDGSLPSSSEIWISEINPGGNGLIESVAELLATRPDSLYRHIELALGARDFEWTNTQLRQMVQWLGGAQPDAGITQAVTQVRQAMSSAEAAQHFAALRLLLVTQGQSIFHAYSVALSMRLLRPNTPNELDSLLAKIHERWDYLEVLHGVEVDVRVLCALFSGDDDLDQAFGNAGQVLPTGNRVAWRFGVLMGLLWPQGHALRAVAMPWSNRFSSFAIDTERLLLEQWLTPRARPIDPAVPDWEEQVRECLLTKSRAIVSVPATRARQLLPKVIAALATEPVQFDYLNVFAQLTEVKRQGDRIEWTFSIPDVL